MRRDPRQAYDTGIKATESSRDLEANALFRAARLLEDCQQAWGDPRSDERLGEALRNNQMLWTLFQSELGRPDHSLAPQLRANLLRLSAFVDRRTFELIGSPDPAGLQALIDINRQVGSGLTAKAAESLHG